MLNDIVFVIIDKGNNNFDGFKEEFIVSVNENKSYFKLSVWLWNVCIL